MKSSCVIQVVVALMLMFPITLFAREGQRSPTSDTPSQAQASEAYVCPMHPDVRADQPGGNAAHGESDICRRMFLGG